MDLQVEELAEGIELVRMSGRLDYAGVEAINPRFSALAASNAPRMIVDLSDVSFLASIGIRSLLTNSRTLKSRGGSMALLKPQPMVEQVLKLTGLGTMIPVFHDLDAAMKATAG